MWLFKSRIPKNATRKYFLGVQLTWGIETDNCQVDRVAQTIFDAYPPCQTVMNHLKKIQKSLLLILETFFSVTLQTEPLSIIAILENRSLKISASSSSSRFYIFIFCCLEFFSNFYIFLRFSKFLDFFLPLLG